MTNGALKVVDIRFGSGILDHDDAYRMEETRGKPIGLKQLSRRIACLPFTAYPLAQGRKLKLAF